jgi:hypothetical protein
MSAWKQFLASDIIVNPFVVNKGFSFPYTQWATGSDDQIVGIDRFLGINVNWFNNQSTTGTLTTQYQALIYNSAKQLYYSNFLSSSTGDDVAQPILVPGAGPSGSGDVFIGKAESPLYDNFLQSTLTASRYWPTGSGDQIAVISIPSKLYGEYIVPNSFVLEYPTLNSTITDDGQGNLNISSSAGGFDGYIGNIIYTHGLAILTDNTLPDTLGYTLDDYVTDTDVTCSFSSSMTIWETQYKCTIRESEFNATLNPSAQASGSLLTINSSSFSQRGDGTLANNVTGSYFSPYVTTVGLYDEAQNLLAIGKLAQPLPTSDTTDTTILVNLDR